MFCPRHRSSLLKAVVLVLVVVTSSQPMHLSPELRGATLYPSVLPRAIVSPMPRSASLDASNPARGLLPSPKMSAVAASVDFAVSVSPGSGSVVQSASLSSIIVSATLLSGTSTSVVFGTQNVPVGITPSFTVASCNMPCYSSLTFSATPTMPTGSYQVTITGTANGMTRTANFQLNVNPFDFCLSVSSPSGPLIQSGTISVVVTACLPYGDSSSTTSVTINPPSFSDLPNGVTPSPSVPVSCNPNCSSTLTLTANSAATLGTYNIPITGTEGKQTKMVTLPLTVASSGMSASPPSATVVQTASVSTVIIDTLPPYPTSLSVSPSSPGITPTFSGLRCNFDTNVCSSTLTFSADSSVTTGIYGFTIPDTGRGFTHSIPFSLTVSLFDFSLSASSASATVVQTASVSISVSAVLPFSDTASTNSVSFSVPNPPPTSITIGFSPISCSLNFQPSCGSTITFSADSSASIGSTYNFGIRAVGGSVTKTIPFSLTIAGFSFSISLSSSSATVVQSASVSTTVSVALPNSDSSSTTSISFQISGGLPMSSGVTFTSASCTPNCSPSLTFTASSTAPAATYNNVKITATGGTFTTTATFSLTVAPFSFSLSLSPNSGSLAQSGTISTAATLTLPSSDISSTTSVSFSVSGLPGNSGITFGSTSCTPNCSPVLAFTASSTAPPTTYSVTITATGGSFSTTATYVLTVIAFDFGISASPSSFSVVQLTNASTTVTATLISGTSAPVSFTVTGIPSSGIIVTIFPSSCSPLYSHFPPH